MYALFIVWKMQARGMAIELLFAFPPADRLSHFSFAAGPPFRYRSLVLHLPKRSLCPLVFILLHLQNPLRIFYPLLRLLPTLFGAREWCQPFRRWNDDNEIFGFDDTEVNFSRTEFDTSYIEGGSAHWIDVSTYLILSTSNSRYLIKYWGVWRKLD